MSKFLPIRYSLTDDSRVVLPDEPPFDGKVVWLRTDFGTITGRWDGEVVEDGGEEFGFSWLCFDDQFSLDLDVPRGWAPYRGKGTIADIASAVHDDYEPPDLEMIDMDIAAKMALYDVEEPVEWEPLQPPTRWERFVFWFQVVTGVTKKRRKRV